MAKEIKPYIPDLDKIAEHCKTPEPVIVDKEEFNDVISHPGKFGLYRGAALSDEEILRAMEIGWIKIFDPEGGFNLLKQIQADAIDFRMDQDFWHYRQHSVSRLIIGQHLEPIRNLQLLEYTYKLPGEEFIFYPNTIVLAKTAEWISLSNVVRGHFDGRSLAARLGLSNHQTAGHFDPGFCGQSMMEISNVNALHLGVRVHERVGSMSFSLLGSPSTRPRTQKVDSESLAQNQIAPFGFWEEKWTAIREESIKEEQARREAIQKTEEDIIGTLYGTRLEDYNRRHSLR